MESKYIIVMIGTWFLFMILAIINAIIRNEGYKPLIGDLRAHQLSTFTFIILIFVVTYFVLKFSNLQISDKEAILLGFLWLMMTITFEFIAGHFIFGNPWEKLIADYNILQGRIWILVLFTILFSPYITNKLT